MNRTLMFATVILCASPVCAVETIKRELEAAPDGRVVIEVTAGTIEVVGTDESRVMIEGTRTGDPDGFEVQRDGKVIYIEDSGFGDRGGESKFVIRVPRESALEAEIISGRVSVRDLTGVIEVSAVSGDVEVQCTCSRMQAESVSGEVSVHNAGLLSRGELASVSGDVFIETALADGANLNVESVSGDVRVVIHGDLDARVRVETGPGGDIDNGFSADRPDRERYSGSESLELRLGDGSGDIDVSVVSGTVTLERK